ncbi:hypothetical protein BDP27DRAFT_1427420 [Rhodocollybia butyracea]|uniref:Uncharacterized protein n=1 Tax=Rhodocollybia butyracea TaxID=206335 RepID=A0A9P5U1X3_9AGAR|nr:hypothetical protein BDP27DRAFT_1427420 [Rhodocollybia butyracea]
MANTSPFWSAYSSAVQRQLLPLVELPKDNQIFILPFTESLATGPLTNEGLNYLIYTLANTTLAADGSTGDYSGELNTYLTTVDESSLRNPAAKPRLDEANKDVARCTTELQQARNSAKVVYDATPDPKPAFDDEWASENWPPFSDAQLMLTSAKSVQESAYNAYWGLTDALHGCQEKLSKALDTQTHYPAFNMSVEDGGASTLKPYYSSPELKDQMNSWLQEGGQGQSLFAVKIDSAAPSLANVQNGIYLNFITKGVAKFNIHAGQWDVAGVKTLYPKRNPDAPSVLEPKYAQPISVLVAYGPKLNVEIREGQNVKWTSSATAVRSIDSPYVTVLGILGQHFPST